MSELNLTLTTVGLLVLFCGIFSVRLENSPFWSRPITALLLGIILGPHGLKLIDPSNWNEHQAYPGPVVEHFSRITIGIGLMGVALRLPKNFIRKNALSLTSLMLIVMPVMWLTSSAIIKFVLDLPWFLSLLAGAVITPTDPILASTVVTGKLAEKNLPKKLRDTLSLESGANDGLAFPLVLLGTLLALGQTEHLNHDWLLKGMLYETLGAIATGSLLGRCMGKLLVLAEKKKWMEEASFLSLSLALTLLVLGAVDLLGMNSILGVFASGIAFDQVVGGTERAQEEKIQEAVNQFFTVPIFTLVGLELPWEQWRSWGWSSFALVVLVLGLRRLPALLFFKRLIPAFRNGKEAAFAGWFGPIGVAAVYYATHVMKKVNAPEVWGIASLIVTASVVIHGLSGAPLTKKMSRHHYWRSSSP